MHNRAMARRPTTAKALLKELEGHISASKANLTVNFNGSTVPLILPNAGIVTGESYAALMIDGKAYILELDHKGTNKSLKTVSPDAAKLAAVVRDLLPEPAPPTPPEEAQAALQLLTSLGGWKLSTDAKGHTTLVPADEKPRRTRAPRGSRANPKPEHEPIHVGSKLRRLTGGKFTANVVYTVDGIDGQTFKLTGEDGTTGDYKGLKESGVTVPRFSTDWERV